MSEIYNGGIVYENTTFEVLIQTFKMYVMDIVDDIEGDEMEMIYKLFSAVSCIKRYQKVQSFLISEGELHGRYSIDHDMQYIQQFVIEPMEYLQEQGIVPSYRYIAI